MSAMKFALIFLAALLAQLAHAEQGDAETGAQLYAQTCLSCHGPGGASQIAINPILSGQHEEYLRRQLIFYRDNPKSNLVMAPMASALSDQDINDISAYLSSRPPAISGAQDMALAESAESLYRGGDISRNIPACSACHGPTGAGVAPEYPALSGQYAEYVITALNGYNNGTRPNAIMSSISSRLTEDEIKALAEYISGLAP